MVTYIRFVAISLLILLSGHYTHSQVDENKNFNCRYEYVMSVFDVIGDTNEDLYLGINLQDKDKLVNYFLFINPYNLYQILYPERKKPSKELLYFSVGKMFLYDTVFLTGDKIRTLEHYVVSADSIEKYNSLGLAKVLNQFMNAEDSCVNYHAALAFYLDRQFYPIIELHNGCEKVALDYQLKQTQTIEVKVEQ